MSKCRSNFEIAITPLIIDLERRSKAQNLGNLTGYRFVTLNFRLDFWLKNSPGHQNGGHFEISKLLQIGPF